MGACTIRLDSHAHLYDAYSVSRWCDAIVQNQRLEAGVIGSVIVVDRAGQDSFARLRSEVAGFASWQELTRNSHTPDIGRVAINGQGFFVIQGVQYVSAERIEVLGLGTTRSRPDGVAASELVKQIIGEGGIACLPWSPGKWLGKRGSVVRSLLIEGPQEGLVFGDISLRANLGPPSLLLREARRAGFRVVPGTDPLPRVADEALVGSYGIEFSTPQEPVGETVWGVVRAAIINKSKGLSVWGAPNKPFRALSRFISVL